MADIAEDMWEGLLSLAVRLELVDVRTEAAAPSTSRSAVSRRFVMTTETALADLLVTDLFTLNLVAIMVYGMHFTGHCCGLRSG